MQEQKTVIVAAEDIRSRNLLARILVSEYRILTACNGREALELLETNKVSAVMIDLRMPEMDGLEFLQEREKISEYMSVPVIVTGGTTDRKYEKEVLSLGAWDYISKPYDADVVRFRVKGAIERSRFTAFARLKYLAEFDELTEIFNKKKFFSLVREILDSSRKQTYVFVRLDVNRFHLVNTYFGTEEGDRVLRHIAERIKQTITGMGTNTAYGRIDADCFGFLIPFVSRKDVLEIAENSGSWFADYELDFDFSLNFGAFIINDRSTAVEVIFDRANLAAKQCKGNYFSNCEFYDSEMGRKSEEEQRVLGEMKKAVEENQFVTFYQPIYDLKTMRPAGAEALVRWLHPKKGVIIPEQFVPLFEHNGFITRLDKYVWEQVCKYIRTMLDKGRKLNPISVNVSCADFFNTHLVEMLSDLITKYNIPTELLQLELTESAYSDNPQAIKQTIDTLHGLGFTILMDDFGSGCSSLSILKNIDVDKLKIDMRFFDDNSGTGKGENIVASVIRMAKWLQIPVIAEGIETRRQMEFLREIGCEYVQGYYFSKPMPQNDYDLLADSTDVFDKQVQENGFDYNRIWNTDAYFDTLFAELPQAAALFEYDGSNISTLRVNKAFYDLFNFGVDRTDFCNLLTLIHEGFRDELLALFKQTAIYQNNSNGDYLYDIPDRKETWMRQHLNYLTKIGDKHLIYGTFSDVTELKQLEKELNKYSSTVSAEDETAKRVLIVDDYEENREILKLIFEQLFEVCEAENGKEAISVLDSFSNRVDIILLDLVMPEMDGIQFLNYKKQHPEIADIPVVIITADNSSEQQVNTLSLGANDYIVKPFVEEAVMRRVCNVIESNKHFRSILREYDNVVEKAQTDPLTGVYNRDALKKLVDYILDVHPNECQAMVMIDIDRFKSVNDTFGHDAGDKVLITIAEQLKAFAQTEDIVARLGGDEFCLFVPVVKSPEQFTEKCRAFCRSINAMNIHPLTKKISVSAGVAYSDNNSRSFSELYKLSDSALYFSKQNGRNTVSVYTKPSD